MNQLVLKTFLMPILVVIFASAAHSSGSWVGNSPVQVASNVSAIYKPTYVSSNTEEMPKVWNSLLLPKGESRLSFSAEYTQWQEDYPPMVSYLIGWDHAFTENLTMFTLLNWGYSLKANNGLGHEWALIGGLGGIQYTSLAGVYTNPEVGIAYSYSEPMWRFTLNSKIKSFYLFDNSSFDWYTLRTEFNYMRWIGEKFGFGVGTAYHLTRNTYQVGNSEDREGRYSTFIEAPTFSGAIKLTKNTEIKASYRFENQEYDGREEFGIGFSITW